MAQQSLYRRYRPRRFGELKGQDHVVRALQNAVANEAEGHAYLFSGPRGTGKTSTARILAKALNCTDLREGEPCCECDSCVSIETGRSFDLFELDAASNNGVDAVRDLVERSAVGSPGRTKVYILDEVHMLTAAASNALLKTLEEPPDHVRFVLATTDPQKVLPTIRSRTQHYEFQLLSAAELEAHVRWVVEDAGLDVDDEAVAHAVRQGRGSVRDTLSALDQVVAAGGVLVRVEPVEQLFAAVAGADSGVAMVAVADALAQGHDPRVLGEAFLGAVRDAFLLSLGVDTPHVVDADRERLAHWATEIGTPGLTGAMERLGRALVDMRNAADPRVPLEVALVQITSTAEPATDAAGSSGEAGVEHSGGARPADGVDLHKELAELRERLDRLESAAAQPAGARQAGVESPGARPPGAQPSGAQAPGAQPAVTEAPVAKAETQDPRSPEPRKQESRAGATKPGTGRAGSPRSAPPPPPPRRASRSGSAAPRKPAPSSETAPAASSPTAPSATAGAEPAGTEGATPRSVPDEAPSPAAASAAIPDRDALVMAFGDVVVPQLKGMAKAIFTGGRFVAVADDTAVFSLDNAPTRERAEKYRPQVEQMLGRHFGVPVSLRLVIESEAGAYEPGPKSAAAAPEARGRDTSTGSPPAQSGPTPARRPSAQDPAAQQAAPEPPGSAQSGSAQSGSAKPNRAQPGNTVPGNTDSDNADSDNAEPSDEQPRTASAATVPDPQAEEAELMAQVDQLEDADVSTSGVDKLTEAFPGAELIETEESSG